MNGIGVSAVNAYTAHREWASRPPDERYASVHALYDAARARRIRTEERTIETVALRTEAVASDALALRDTSGRQAALTNWSFEQLAGIAAAPPKYLRTLPAAIEEQLMLLTTLTLQPVVDRVGRDRGGQRPEVFRRRGGDAGELLEAPVRESGLATRRVA